MYFFLFILLFLILLLFFFPEYTKKDLVPPLSSSNYNISNDTGSVNTSDVSLTTFKNLIITDGTSSGSDAIDFGASEGDTTEISYIPYYSEMYKRLIGFFELNIATKYENSFIFRVIDDAEPGTPGNLGSYNKGWTSLNTINQAENIIPLYNVKIPFDFQGFEDRGHLLGVQMSSTTAPGNGSSVQLSSAYLYYKTY